MKPETPPAEDEENQTLKQDGNIIIEEEEEVSENINSQSIIDSEKSIIIHSDIFNIPDDNTINNALSIINSIQNIQNILKNIKNQKRYLHFTKIICVVH